MIKDATIHLNKAPINNSEVTPLGVVHLLLVYKGVDFYYSTDFWSREMFRRRQFFNYNLNSCSHNLEPFCYPFLQLMWKNTTSVGCRYRIISKNSVTTETHHQYFEYLIQIICCYNPHATLINIQDKIPYVDPDLI